jgi:hypothetical protein
MVSGTRVGEGIFLSNAQTGDIVYNGYTPVGVSSFSPNGACVAAVYRYQTIYVWNIPSGDLVCSSFKEHIGAICSLSISPDGTRVASGSDAHTIRIWETKADQSESQSTINDWNLDEGGWVTGPNSQLLLWVPRDLRTGLKFPRNTAVIHNHGSFELDFDGVLMGSRWAECYSDSFWYALRTK